MAYFLTNRVMFELIFALHVSRMLDKDIEEEDSLVSFGIVHRISSLFPQGRKSFSISPLDEERFNWASLSPMASLIFLCLAWISCYVDDSSSTTSRNGLNNCDFFTEVVPPLLDVHDCPRTSDLR